MALKMLAAYYSRDCGKDGKPAKPAVKQMRNRNYA